MSNKFLEISDLAVSIDNKKILNGVSLSLDEGKMHVLMGPNGSGKSTLAQTLMGHPQYSVDSGTVSYLGENLIELEPNERALKGIFLSFQYPSEVTGVTISSYLRMIYNKRHSTSLSPIKFREYIKPKLELLDMDDKLLSRYLNDGFSGGEKKRMEMLQMLVLEPKLAILDETDSGLDVDAIKIVSKAITQLDMTVLLITHYTRILKYLEVDKVFVMQDGKIIKEGDSNLAHELEEQGFTNEHQ